MLVDRKRKNKEVFKHEKLNDVALKLLAKAAYAISRDGPSKRSASRIALSV